MINLSDSTNMHGAAIRFIVDEVKVLVFEIWHPYLFFVFFFLNQIFKFATKPERKKYNIQRPFGIKHDLVWHSKEL